MIELGNPDIGGHESAKLPDVNCPEDKPEPNPSVEDQPAGI